MPYALCSCSNHPGAEAELDPAAAHRVDLRHLHREDRRQTVGDRRHERPEPECRRVASEACEGGPRVGGAGERVAAAHPQIVIGAEEPCEAEALGCLREHALVVVAEALLGLGEDAVFHVPRAQSLDAMTIASVGGRGSFGSR